MARREHWGTRIGLILAMAGNAIGFGNFLRFPVQAAQNGGGAFMIPHFIALLLIGLPLMWIEWGMGRFGGVRGHGTTPGMFELLWRNRAAKYFGLLGVALPLFVVIYYIYIESWTLAYVFFSARGDFNGMSGPEIGSFFGNLTGGNAFPIYFFFIATVLLNLAIMWRGVSGGIENALIKAVELECPVIQIFTKNARQWSPPPLKEDNIKMFIEMQKETGIIIASHDSYLINLAAKDKQKILVLFNSSVNEVIDLFLFCLSFAAKLIK